MKQAPDTEDAGHSRPDEDPVATILDRILALPAAELGRALDEACAAHPLHAPLLRARIQALAGLGLLDESAGAGIPERLGEFRLLERIGSGGMGVVFRARQEPLGREVALKILRPEFSFLEHGRSRMRREVEAIARLEHPGIVPIHLFGESGGIAYYAMEFLRGASLQDAIDRLRGTPPAQLDGGRLAAIVGGDAAAAPAWGGGWSEVVARILVQVADALAHAHERGVVHRDLKPSNLMLAPNGSVRLVDFGLAQHAGAERLTRTGAQLGSLPYSSPEQVRGQKLDGRTDLWSLGVVAYELLTLEQPFLADDQHEVLRRVVEREPPEVTRRNPAVAEDLAAIVHRLIEKEPARRYADAGALAADLRAFLAWRPVSARRPNARERLRRWVRREPLRAALAATLLLGVPTVAALGGYLLANLGRMATGAEEQRRQRIEQGLAAGFLALSQDSPRDAAAAFRTVLAEEPDHAEAAAGLAAASADPTDRPLPEPDPTRATASELFVASVPRIERGPRGDAAQATHALRLLQLARDRCARARPVYYFQSVRAAALLGDAAVLRALAAALLELWPSDPLAQYWAGCALLELDAPAARRAFEQCLALAPRLGAAAGMLGLLALRDGDSARARSHLQQAAALAPDAVEPRINLAIACVQAGDPTAARAAIDAALALRPDHPGAQYNRGIVALAAGDREQALAAFTRATELDPYYREAWNNRAALECERGEHAAAEASFRRLTDVATDWAQAHHNLALLLQRRGAHADALLALNRAAELAPADPDVHADLLALLQQLGDEVGIAAEQARFRRANGRQPR